MSASDLTQAQLATLPRHDGFRLRGVGINRLETLVYAAFAFALTLLVISVGAIPDNLQQLVSALKQVPALALSFLMLMVIWRAYALWSERFGLDDAASIWLSSALMFTVMVYVYPLRAMTVAGASFFTGGWLPSEFQIRSATDLGGLFATYGSAFALLAGLMAAHYHLGLRRAGQLQLDACEQEVARAERGFWLFASVVGLVSAVAALLLPGYWKTLAPWLYFLIGILGWRLSRRVEAAPLLLAPAADNQQRDTPEATADARRAS